MLCQQQTREALVDPIKSLRCDPDAGYRYFAHVLPKFEGLGELPPHLLMSPIDQGGGGLAETFKSNSAKWHKSCRNNFSERQLERKSASAEKHSSTTGVSVASCSDVACESTDVKCICTRSEITSENPLCATTHVSFFCDLPADSRHPLHEVSTLDSVDKQVKECALVFSDHRLLAKLAIGDMAAIEAKYHANCLTQLYNRRRSFEREIKNSLVQIVRKMKMHGYIDFGTAGKVVLLRVIQYNQLTVGQLIIHSSLILG